MRQRRTNWISVFASPIVFAHLSGCALISSPVLDPKGPVALAQRDLMLTAFALMLIVVVPVIVLTLYFARRYRADGGATYTPDWEGSTKLETVLWVVPALMVITLGVMVYRSTIELDPYRTLVGQGAPLDVQVVSLDWKYLFIYPEQNIASVNELVFPAGRPLTLHMTSDGVMTALIVPALGGQVYAMAGMQTKLNLLADDVGTFDGRNAMFSGEGFPDMTFSARAVSQGDFDVWTEQVVRDGSALTGENYPTLAAPSIANPVSTYAPVADGLFQTIINSHGGATMQMQNPRLP